MSLRRDRPIFPGGRTTSDLPPLIRVDPRTLAYFAVVLVLVWLAGWLYLHQASEAAAYAHEIRGLMQSKERLRRDIIALRAQVALEGSLNELRATGEQWHYSLPAASDPQRRLVLEAELESAPAELTDEPLIAPTSEREVKPLQTWLRDLYVRLSRRNLGPSGTAPE